MTLDTSKIVSYPKPHIAMDNLPLVFFPNITIDVEIRGSYFTKGTVVESSSPDITFNGLTEFVDSHQIIANITVGPAAVPGLFDLHICNPGLTTEPNGFKIVGLIVNTWSDLRDGGDTLTIGTSDGDDIQYGNMSSAPVRGPNGLTFPGAAIWASWARFNQRLFTRAGNQTVEIVLSGGWSAFWMVGISSTGASKTNNVQYPQAETLAFFNGTNVSGLWGNSGTPGSIGNSSAFFSVAPAGPTDFFKLQITNAGSAGGLVSVYRLPGGNPVDWDDVSTLINSASIAGTINPDEPILMPAVVPNNTCNLVAVRLV